MSSETRTVEQAILEDIRHKTGLTFAHIESIDTRDRKTAEAVLPILREWLPSVTEDNYRHAVYSRFLTRHAGPYVDSLMEWWQVEKYSLASNCLAQALAISAKPSHAEPLWQLCRMRLRQPFTFMILAKLATFPSVAAEVRDALIESLQDPSLTVGDLQHIAQVDDPRIQKWFEGQTDSPNRYLRQLARRVVERGEKLPKCVTLVVNPPARTAELFSAEVDLSEVPELLQQLQRDIKLKLPRSVRHAAFLSALDLDRWAVVSGATAGGAPVNLWFRMEDVDTVEIVVTRDSTTHIQ